MRALSGLRGGEAAVLAQPAASRPTPSPHARDRHHDADARRSCAARRTPPCRRYSSKCRTPRGRRGSVPRCCAARRSRCSAPRRPARRPGAAGAAARAAAGRGGDPTAPGGRAGPGGAPAFPREGAAGRAAPLRQTMRRCCRAARGGRGGRGGGANVLRLNREPAELSALAAAGGDLGTRAAALLARIEWPGKPGASAPVTPLTAEEQQRFAAGQTVYQSICLPCHQEDGRGKEAIAPSLVASAFATGAADDSRPHPAQRQGGHGRLDAAARAGVHRRADRQRADLRAPAVGQHGHAGRRAGVKDTRAAVAGRTRPWTNAELTALSGSAGARRSRSQLSSAAITRSRS